MTTAGSKNILIVFLAAGSLAGCEKKENDAAVSQAAIATNGKAPVPASADSTVLSKLTGKWQRADGDYTVEIRSVEPGGNMDAAYFNPQPINVSKAGASRDGSTIKLFIELRDVNYPGSRYTLIYDSANDRLAGTYFQAVARETYDVFFVRMKP